MRSTHAREYAALLELLRDPRTQAGLSQVELARRLRCPQKYENAERQLDVLEFLEITKALAVDPTRLIGKLQGSK